MHITLLLSLMYATQALARQAPATYKQEVEWATKEQKKPLPRKAVYVWPWVKAPGAYAFKSGMTVADLVRAAGGLIKDERYPTIPSSYFPQTIYVKRPSKKDPNPTASTYRCKLDWEKADAGIEECDFKLQKGDFAGISMSPVVP